MGRRWGAEAAGGSARRERWSDACGWVNHLEIPRRLAAADVFGFPSIREFGGAVVLEAMAQGCVPLIVNYGGPAELATRETGFLWSRERGRGLWGRFGMFWRGWWRILR